MCLEVRHVVVGGYGWGPCDCDGHLEATWTKPIFVEAAPEDGRDGVTKGQHSHQQTHSQALEEGLHLGSGDRRTTTPQSAQLCPPSRLSPHYQYADCNEALDSSPTCPHLAVIVHSDGPVGVRCGPYALQRSLITIRVEV